MTSFSKIARLHVLPHSVQESKTYNMTLLPKIATNFDREKSWRFRDNSVFPDPSGSHQQADDAGARKRGSAPQRGRHSTICAPPSASAQLQPDGLTIHTEKCFLGAGFLGATSVSLKVLIIIILLIIMLVLMLLILCTNTVHNNTNTNTHTNHSRDNTKKGQDPSNGRAPGRAEMRRGNPRPSAE